MKIKNMRINHLSRYHAPVIEALSKIGIDCKKLSVAALSFSMAANELPTLTLTLWAYKEETTQAIAELITSLAEYHWTIGLVNGLERQQQVERLKEITIGGDIPGEEDK